MTQPAAAASRFWRHPTAADATATAAAADAAATTAADAATSAAAAAGFAPTAAACLRLQVHHSGHVG